MAVPVRPRLRVQSRRTQVLLLCFILSPCSFNRWRCGRVVCGRLLFAAQIIVFAERMCLKINFRPIVHQPRQSPIATTFLALLKPAAVARSLVRLLLLSILDWVYLAVFCYCGRWRYSIAFNLWRCGRVVCGFVICRVAMQLQP